MSVTNWNVSATQFYLQVQRGQSAALSIATKIFQCKIPSSLATAKFWMGDNGSVCPGIGELVPTPEFHPVLQYPLLWKSVNVLTWHLQAVLEDG